MNTELLELAADARLAQLDLNAARRAHQAGQVTDRELSMTEAERDSALEFYEEAEALADEAAPLFAPRPWLADGAYVPTESRDEAEQEWAAEVLTPRYSYLICSVRGGEPFPSTNRFWTLADLRKFVQREMRGMSCFWQVLVTDNGEQVGRGYRSGYNGTGDRWAWELPN